MTSDTREASVLAIYDSHGAAEAAVKELQEAGLDMKRLSIVGKGCGTDEHTLGFYTSGRVRAWGVGGAYWGGLWGMLFAGALFFIPAIGSLVVKGPLVGWIASALVGGAAGVLAAAFTSIGFTKESVVKYELAVKAGSFLVVARGTSDMVVHARAVLATTCASQLTAQIG